MAYTGSNISFYSFDEFQSGSFSNLFETGTGVNAPADASGQSPAHLAACGGEAFFLLWQLQTGANLNQQVKNTFYSFHF